MPVPWADLGAGSLVLNGGVRKMGEPKPTASLSSLLLARKGAARPAMRRPSMMGNMGLVGTNQDDLGWNDMGYDVDPAHDAPMDHDHNNGYSSLANAVPEVNQEVRQQQERIAEQLQVQAERSSISEALAQTVQAPDIQVSAAELLGAPSPVLMGPVEVNTLSTAPVTVIHKPATTPTKRAASGQKSKAAFTLRLDADRHLKLRLACAVNNRSAQMLVTDALDAFLDAMPEIGQLAAHVPAR